MDHRLLASGDLRIQASEPDYRLAQAGLVRREIVLDASQPSLPVTGALGVAQGKVVGARWSLTVPPGGVEAAIIAGVRRAV